MSDVPPAWSPYYFSGGWFRMGTEEPQFRLKGKFEFEFLGGDEGDDPALAAACYAKDFPTRIAERAKWLATGGWDVAPGAISGSGAIHSIAITARRGTSAIEGRVSFSADPSHWVKVEVHLGAFRVFVGYMDRPWEEFQIWPSGMSEHADDSPGRVSKRYAWVNLSAAAWPTLAPFADQGWFSLEEPDLNVIQV